MAEKDVDPSLSIPDENDLQDVKDIMGPTPEQAKPGEFANNSTEVVEPTPEASLPDDSTTSEAVEDIVATESTELINAEDEKREAIVNKKPKLWERIKSAPSKWWHNKKLRNWTLVGLLLFIALLFIIPVTRYLILNTLGVRASANVVVVDDTNGQPIKKAKVTIDNISTETDEEGKAMLNDLKLGETTLNINKRAYAEVNQNITIGWGSNPFQEFRLTPTGSQYTFVFTDWLSDTSIDKVKVSNDESSTVSNNEGVAVFTYDPGEVASFEVSIEAEGYRTEKTTVPSDQKEKLQFKLVAGSPNVFMSRRTGNYDMYMIDADGKNETLLLSGTGKERENGMTLSPSPDFGQVAYVSTRTGQTNADGYALESLILVNPQTKEITELAISEQVRIIGWVDSTIVYIKVASGNSGASAEREKLITYDYVSKNTLQLQNSNQFNDVAIMNGQVYIAPSNIYGDNPGANLTRVETNGTDKATVLDRQTYSLIRTAYDQFSISTIGNKWYSYTAGEQAAKEVEAAPAVPRDRRYVDNTSGSESAWYDYRDGKGVVVIWDKEGKNDTVLYSQGGLITPFRWLSNRHLAFRISTNQETADYVIDVESGKTAKVVDVVDIDTESYRGY